jgi:hypothetical protein
MQRLSGRQFTRSAQMSRWRHSVLTNSEPISNQKMRRRSSFLRWMMPLTASEKQLRLITDTVSTKKILLGGCNYFSSLIHHSCKSCKATRPDSEAGSGSMQAQTEHPSYAQCYTYNECLAGSVQSQITPFTRHFHTHPRVGRGNRNRATFGHVDRNNTPKDFTTRATASNTFATYLIHLISKGFHPK